MTTRKGFPMPPSSVLSSEERRFLQKLLHASPADQRQKQTFDIDGGEAANALLENLATHSKLSLEAHHEDVWMSFPVELKEDEFHTLQLQLGAPQIFEYGPDRRPWRLRLDPPLPLLNTKNGPTQMQVRELSSGGLLIEFLDGQKPPLKLAAHLPLPGTPAVPFKATLVRSSNHHCAAYTLLVRHPLHSERLRTFIFEQHNLQHGHQPIAPEATDALESAPDRPQRRLVQKSGLV
jgi:hypothetical protein